jgi:diguanylate cyclase (GGDEF)-like protein
MMVDCERRRVLLVGSIEGRRELLEAFTGKLFEAWDTVQASSFLHARFVAQHQPCDVVLVDERALYGDEPVFSWLAAHQRAPMLLLSDAGVEKATSALEHGANIWLPRKMTLAHPPLLAAALQQLFQLGELRRRARLAGEALYDSRRQVNRLVGMLWDAAPNDGHTRWFTQRHMMERLEEEAARAERHGTPLAVVLGELEADILQDCEKDAQALLAWSTDRINRTKRRQDVAGQYGPNGFMLLLGHTSESGAIACCRRLESAMQHAPLPVGVLRGPIQVHFGVADFSESAKSSKQLLSQAEESLEKARATGTALAMI